MAKLNKIKLPIGFKVQDKMRGGVSTDKTFVNLMTESNNSMRHRPMTGKANPNPHSNLFPSTE